MQFVHYAGPQRVQDWYDLRMGKVTASRLSDWLAVSKAKNSLGKPLKARLDYETELIYERTFNSSFNNYVTEAMQDGIDLEKFAIAQYEKITGNTVYEPGAWYSDIFMASPDGIVNSTPEGEPGKLIEVKVLRDSAFTDVLINGVPDKYMKQIQGQLFASGYKVCDFIAINTNSKKVKIIRVEADLEFFEYLELALQEKLTVAEFAKDNLYDFKDALPDNYHEEVVSTNGGAW